MKSLFSAVAECLAVCDPDEKLQSTARVQAAWLRGELAWSTSGPPAPIGAPGRPQRPWLVPPRALPKRGLGSRQGRAALIHAVAHIEFNAINLAWDAVYRFRDMPRAFYDDWSRVAAEEAYHFRMLRDHLRHLGHEYGDFDAHNGLWEMAEKTAHDPLVRMALVPRVLEARGLDVTPGMIERLKAHGEESAAGTLEIILRDEIGHVAIGSRWYRHLCEERGLDPAATFSRLLRDYMKGRIKGPLNVDARVAGGFQEAELRDLETLCGEKT